MQVAAKSYLTAGVALVGASAIAVAPVQVAPPDIKLPAPRVSSAAVALTASPIAWYTEVVERTIGNAEGLAEIFLANPAPILQQILANQTANVESLLQALGNASQGIAAALTEQVPVLLETAFTQLSNGNVEGALNTLLSAPLTFALPLLEVVGAVITPVTEAVANFNRVVQDVLAAAVLGGALAVAGPVLSGVGSVGSAIQDVIDGAGTGDPIEIVNAFVNAPGVIADGILNGGYGPLLLGLLPAPGVLTPDGLLGPLGAGPIGFGLAIRDAIAQALGAPALALGEAPASEVDGTTDDLATGEGPAAANAMVNEQANLVGLQASAGTDASLVGDPVPADGLVAGDTSSETEETGETEGEEDAPGTDNTDVDTGTTPNGGTNLSDGNMAEPPSADNTDSNKSGSTFVDRVRDGLKRAGINTGGLGLGGDNGDDAGDADTASGGGTGSGGSDGGSGGDE
jgi:hypothetical protein